MTVAFSNVVTKQLVEAWAEGLDFEPEEQIAMLLEEKFDATAAIIQDAHSAGDSLMLMITTDVWEQPREFALLKSGSLVW